MMRSTQTETDFNCLAWPAKDAAAALGISRAQFWKLYSAGKLPAPIRLGSKTPRWVVDGPTGLRAWIAAGCPDRATWQRMIGGKR